MKPEAVVEELVSMRPAIEQALIDSPLPILVELLVLIDKSKNQEEPAPVTEEKLDGSHLIGRRTRNGKATAVAIRKIDERDDILPFKVELSNGDYIWVTMDGRYLAPGKSETYYDLLPQ